MVYKTGSPRSTGKKGPRDARGTAFADTYPLHVVSIPTVHQFASALALALPPPASTLTSEKAQTGLETVLYDLEQTIARFRPNIVVSLPPPPPQHPSSLSPAESQAFEEDRWGLVDIGPDILPPQGGAGLEVVGRCGRCTVSPVLPRPFFCVFFCSLSLERGVGSHSATRFES